MTDADEPRPGNGPGDPAAGPRADEGHEPVGSVGEEAAKLLGALSDWARDQGTDYAGTAAGAASHLADALGQVDEHLATGGEDCRYCPVCRAISVVRGTSPEVRMHLGQAASSLMHAASGLLATPTGGQASAPVERIDLDDDSDWDEEP